MIKNNINAKNILMKFIIILLATIGFILINQSIANGAWISSDIEGIDESKYPGYKSQIQSLQRKYPNWSIKLYYTGLDWNSTLTAENEGHGESPVSLSYYTYKGEWICPICGEKRFDVSGNWYCASRKAIAYMMDPRNSLTEEWVFQFQNLGSSAGNRSEIEKMVQGTFLNNTTCIDAIMQAAQTYNISPFHLVSRITQEQGTAGIGTMNGYIYITPEGTPVKVYNLFNIKTSGNDDAGFLAGAKFAYENGWFTQEASILGGAKFLRENYIDYGQSTLYFQKYNVVYTDKLYRHQYMQNIRAANDEGNKIYNAYKNTGILSSHFEFLIPVYENMPSEASPRPSSTTESYVGDITTDVQEISLNKDDGDRCYITGKILVSEWIDGITWSIPRNTPKIRVISLDGTQSFEMSVSVIEQNNYYFEGYIDGIDTNKQYRIEVESGDTNNISQYRKVGAACTFDKTLGQYRRDLLSIEGSILTFTPTNYYGDIAMDILETNLNKNDNGHYISGRVLVSEWIGKIWNEPDMNPKIEIVSTEGDYRQELWVMKETGNQYYFDGYIDGLDKNKEYYIYVTLSNTYNISQQKSARVTYKEDFSLGEFGEYDVKIEDGKLVIKERDYYIGDLSNEITSLELKQNPEGKTYIEGEVLVSEWIDGVTWSIPRTTPIIRLKSTDGTEVYECWEMDLGENNYYFNVYIEGIDPTKEYEIEIESGSSKNTSAYRIVKGVYNQNKQLGAYQDIKVKIENNNIIFDAYRGDLSNDITSLEIKQNAEGRTYIEGEVLVSEWLNGVTWSIPRETPIIRLKSTDGTEVYECWEMDLGGNNYYFDVYIEGIDTSKEYEIEIESGSEKNISSYRKVAGVYNQNKELGEYHGDKVEIENSKIRFSESTYRGDLSSDITKLELKQNAEGKTYIEGEVLVSEWIDGVTWSIPRTTPIIRLKSTDGTESYECWEMDLGENNYYFNVYIEGIDTSKEYEIEIESGSSKNTSPYRKITGVYNQDNDLGKYQEKNVRIENNIISFNDTKTETLKEENVREIINSNDELVLNEENNIDDQDEKIDTEEETEKLTNKTENEALEEKNQSEGTEKNDIETVEENQTENEETQIENVQE